MRTFYARLTLALRGLILFLLLFPLLLVGLVRFFIMLVLGDEAAGKRALRGLDMAANATALDGDPFETVSSHCGRIKTTWWARGVIWITDRVDQPGHCAGAAEYEAPLLKLIHEFKSQPSKIGMDSAQ
jgi:hypothetical protein